MELNEMYDLQEKLASYYSAELKSTISRENIIDALFIAFEHQLEWTGDVWDLNIEYKQALVALNNIDFDAIRNPLVTEDIIPRRFLLMERKVRVKNAGRTWIVHRYDADPFPSDPHAHELDQNVKLDLSNGDLYRKKNLLCRISRKELLAIREKLLLVYKGAIPPLCII